MACGRILPGIGDARARVHIFNAFFLKQLKMALKQPTLQQKHEALDRLLRWVQDVKLFEKVCECIVAKQTAMQTVS